MCLKSNMAMHRKAYETVKAGQCFYSDRFLKLLPSSVCDIGVGFVLDKETGLIIHWSDAIIELGME